MESKMIRSMKCVEAVKLPKRPMKLRSGKYKISPEYEECIHDMNEDMYSWYHEVNDETGKYSNSCELCDNIMMLLYTMKRYRELIQYNPYSLNLFNTLREKVTTFYVDLIERNFTECTCGFYNEISPENDNMLGSVYMMNELWKYKEIMDTECHVECKCGMDPETEEHDITFDYENDEQHSETNDLNNDYGYEVS